MKTRILEEIRRAEEKYGITVLYACETGSRAWGFPSPDSDYDIRLIYKHNIDWYLCLSKGKDNIEYMSDDKAIDLTGWDIRKSLKLLWKSNGSLLERIQSPVVYTEKEGFIDCYLELAKRCYSPIATMHHYLNMAGKSYEEVKGKDEARLKRLFYALRGSMACKWIMDRDEMPPILFTKMVEELDLDSKLKEKIYSLIELKSTKNESYIHEKEEMILNFIDSTLEVAKEKASSLKSRDEKHVDLDEYFREVIKGY